MSVASSEEPGEEGGGVGDTIKIIIHALILALIVRDVPVPAVQHPVGLDEADAADRRLSVRLEIRLRL